MSKVAVIAHAGKTFGGGLLELRRELEQQGIADPLWCEVAKSSEAPRHVERALDSGAELIFVWGGDGTVQRCLDTAAGSAAALAILPAGTANLFASNLQIPRDIERAVGIGLRGDRRRLDVGRFNGERFGVMAGAGFDATMIRQADGNLKDRFGRAAYVWTASQSLRVKPFTARIAIDGATWYKGRASCILVGNVGHLFGGIEVFADAKPGRRTARYRRRERRRDRRLGPDACPYRDRPARQVPVRPCHERPEDQRQARSQGPVRARRRRSRKGQVLQGEGGAEGRHRVRPGGMRGPSPPAPELLLGPLLRYAGTENATFWVETSAPCDVEILGHKARTFNVEGHHYALVVANDLEPASVTPYDVRLDGRLVWPPRDGRPQPVVHTRNHEHRARLVFGSCRVGGPQPDAAHRAVAGGLAGDRHRRPLDVLETAPARRGRMARRASSARRSGVCGRGVPCHPRVHREPPRHDRGSGPGNRRLRGIHPPLPRVVGGSRDSLALLDRAHSDDLRRPRRPRRLEHVVALGAGNAVEALVGGPDHRRLHVVLDLPAPGQSVATRARRGNDVPARARGRGRRPPAPPIRRRCATASPLHAGGRTFATSATPACSSSTRGRRACWPTTDGRWWTRRSGTGSSITRPAPSTISSSRARCRSSFRTGIHHLEAWNEALCDGRWGRWVASISERLRRAVDLEHWAAFNESFERLCGWLRTVRAGARDDLAPATILLLGGDVHHAYVSEIEFDSNPGSRVYQLVCSPFRNPLPPRERRIVRVTGSRAAGVAFAALARIAGVPVPSASWRFVRSPTFDNSIGELVLEGRSARVTVRRSPHEDEDVDRLVVLHRTDLALETLSEATPDPREGALDDAHAHG